MVPMPDMASVATLRQNSKGRGYAVRRAINWTKTAKCALTSVQAGDQLLVSFQLPAGHQAPLNLKVQASTMKGDDMSLGLPFFPLAFETFRPLHSTQHTLLSTSGNNFVSISISSVDQIDMEHEPK